MPIQLDTYGDLDCINLEDGDDAPPDRGGATDPDAIPARQFIEQMERARSNRAKEIRRHLRLPTDDIPDRLPDGYYFQRTIDGKDLRLDGLHLNRGRKTLQT